MFLERLKFVYHVLWACGYMEDIVNHRIILIALVICGYTESSIPTVISNCPVGARLRKYSINYICALLCSESPGLQSKWRTVLLSSPCVLMSAPTER
jgi:hypothetical protein